MVHRSMVLEELKSCQVVFHGLADISNLQTEDDLDVVALLDDAGVGGLVDQLFVQQSNVLDVDAQTGEAVLNSVDVLLAAQVLRTQDS